jgi:uncharacterized membrane protein YkvA (DUF1232 family)
MDLLVALLAKELAGTSGEADRQMSVAALTYLFGPEDYLDDDTRMIGLLDDLHVLRLAAAMLRPHAGPGAGGTPPAGVHAGK